MNFEDILYEVRNGVAWITINRADKMNAFRGTTCDEIIKALNKAGYDREVGCIVLAGAGDRAFCTGGDQSAHDGNYDGRGTIGLPMEELHDRHPRRAQASDRPRAGFCHRRRQRAVHDMRPDYLLRKSRLRPGRPKMGSVDPGYGTAFLARVVGEKKAREIWYLNKRYSGAEAVAMGLANVCVPHEQLDATVQSGPRRSASAAQRPSRSPSAASTWTPRTRAASPAWACMRSSSITTPKSRAKASMR
jgi:2-ketocyclohexanecarboxyl-CoA hydrolase